MMVSAEMTVTHSSRVRDSERVNKKGKGGAEMLDGKKAKVQEETVEWRADDLRQKEI